MGWVARGASVVLLGLGMAGVAQLQAADQLDALAELVEPVPAEGLVVEGAESPQLELWEVAAPGESLPEQRPACDVELDDRAEAVAPPVMELVPVVEEAFVEDGWTFWHRYDVDLPEEGVTTLTCGPEAGAVHVLEDGDYTPGVHDSLTELGLVVTAIGAGVAGLGAVGAGSRRLRRETGGFEPGASDAVRLARERLSPPPEDDAPPFGAGAPPPLRQGERPARTSVDPDRWLASRHAQVPPGYVFPHPDPPEAGPS